MLGLFVRRTAVLCVAAFALPAWACFPAPDAKPKHEISVLDLPSQPVSGTVLVAFESEGYSLRAVASDLLPELSQDHMGVVSPRDLANALRSKMALGQDIDAQELTDVLITDARSGGDATGANLSWIHLHAKDRLRYAFAKLLQESKVSVTEISSEHVVPQIKLDRFSEICHGGRRFTSLDDKVILYVQDWIS